MAWVKNAAAEITIVTMNNWGLGKTIEYDSSKSTDTCTITSGAVADYAAIATEIGNASIMANDTADPTFTTTTKYTTISMDVTKTGAAANLTPVVTYYSITDGSMVYIKMGTMFVLQITGTTIYNATLTMAMYNVIDKPTCMIVPAATTTSAVFIKAASFIGAVAAFLYV
jgi:hypothetical protein